MLHNQNVPHGNPPSVYRVPPLASMDGYKVVLDEIP